MEGGLVRRGREGGMGGRGRGGEDGSAGGRTPLSMYPSNPLHSSLHASTLHASIDPSIHPLIHASIHRSIHPHRNSDADMQAESYLHVCPQELRKFVGRASSCAAVPPVIDFPIGLW